MLVPISPRPTTPAWVAASFSGSFTGSFVISSLREPFSINPHSELLLPSPARGIVRNAAVPSFAAPQAP